MKRYILLVVLITSCFIGVSNEPYQFNGVGITNTIGSTLQKDIALLDAYDSQVFLSDIVSKKPTIINFVYLNCPLLCHLMLDGLAEVMKESRYNLQEDYQVISISIDPTETNQNLLNYRKKYLKKLGADSGWYFLKGTKQTISAITKQFGYSFNYIPRTNDYAHPSVLYFYNNKLTNYIEGVTFDAQSFDYSIMTTKETKTLKERVITYCYYFDPDNQTYSLYIMNIVRVACLITVLIIGIFILRMYRNEKMK